MSLREAEGTREGSAPSSDSADLALAERRLRRTIGTAALVWLAAYVVRALTTLDRVDRPLLLGVGLAVWLAGAGVALRPLVRRLSMLQERREPVVVATTLPLAAVCGVLAGPVSGWGTPALWIDGGALVPLAALVLVGRTGLAVVSGGSMLLLQVAAVGVAASAGTPQPVESLTTLWVLVPLWVGGSWAVRDHLHRAREHGHRLRARRAAQGTDRLLLERWTSLRARHRDDLDAELIPLLSRVSRLPADAEVPAADRADAAAAASALRDMLLARSLMSSDLRDQVAAARRSGVRVLLHNAMDDGPALDALRVLVGVLLSAPALESLAVRTFADTHEASLVLRFGELFDRTTHDSVRDSIGTGLDGWRTATVHDLDGVVMVELAGAVS